MPSTFTSSLALEKMASGENDNTWGDKTNVNLDLIDTAMGWQTVAYTAFVTPQASPIFVLPGQYRRFRLQFQDFSSPVATGLVLNYSVDGGDTFLQGAQDYGTNVITSLSGIPAPAPVTGATFTLGYVPLSPGNTANVDCGHVEFVPYGNKWGIFTCAGLTDQSTMFMTQGCFFCSNAAAATHVQIGFADAGGSTGGRIKLLGSV